MGNVADDLPISDPLATPVQFLNGVGPARAALLAKLEIFTVHDLLWHLPRDVLDLSQVKTPNQLVEDAVQSVRGVVCDKDARITSTGKHMTAALFDFFKRDRTPADPDLGAFIRRIGRPALLAHLKSNPATADVTVKTAPAPYEPAA